MRRCAYWSAVGVSSRWVRNGYPRCGEIAAEYPGVQYRAFDLSEAGPACRAMLAEVRELFDTQELHRLPVTAWDVRCAPRRPSGFFGQARHIGELS